jgi:feruloyl esterase
MARVTRFAFLSTAVRVSLALCVRAEPCSEQTFNTILANITGTKLNYFASVPAGSDFGDAETNLGYPANATNLPELCAASINVKSSETSSFNFGIFLPTKWNGRMMTTGNGGFAGGINYPDMGILTQYGFATISTDTGHNSNLVDGSWGYQQPEKQRDWGYRSIHGSVAVAKQVIREFYHKPIHYSYYAGCSTGE